MEVRGSIYYMAAVYSEFFLHAHGSVSFVRQRCCSTLVRSAPDFMLRLERIANGNTFRAAYGKNNTINMVLSL